MDSLSKDVDYIGLQNKTVKDVQDCIRELGEASRDDDLPILDDSPALYRFCTKLELLLQLGLKDGLGRVPGNYFSFLEESLKVNRNLEGGVAVVERQKHTNEIGRGRAFLRYSLAHRLLAETIQHCLENSKVVRKYYSKPESVFYNSDLCRDLVNSLYDLNDLTFSLDPHVPDLGVAWPRQSSRVVHRNFVQKLGSPGLNQSDNFSDCWSIDGQQTPRSTIGGSLGCSEGESCRDQEVFWDACTSASRSQQEMNDTGKHQRNGELHDRDLITVVENLTTEMEKMKEGSKAREQLCEELRRQLDELEAENAKLRLRVEESLGERRKTTSEREKEEEEEDVERLAREHREDATEIERLHEKIAEMEREARIKEEIIGSMTSTVERLERNAEQLRMEADGREDSAVVDIRKLERELRAYELFLERLQSSCLLNLQMTSGSHQQADESALENICIRLEAMVHGQAVNPQRSERVQSRRALSNESLESVDESEHLMISELQERLALMDEERRSSEEERNRLKTTLERSELERETLVKQLEAELRDSKARIRELKDDMEVMVGSYKRREILMEETRGDFERTMEKIAEEHAGEVETYKAVVRQLEAKISDELTLEKKQHLEAEIKNMEEELAALREEFLVAQCEYREKLDEMNNKLERMEEENVSLRNQVSMLSKESRSDRAIIRIKEEQWKSQKMEYEEKIAGLKSSFTRVLKDKKQLWERCQDLMDKEQALYSYKWEDPSKVHNCYLCSARFSISIRKHHCRRCGKVFCASCCNKWLELPHSNKKSRTCNMCAEMSTLDSSHLDTPEETDNANSLDNFLEASQRSFDSFDDPGPDSLLPPEVCVPHTVTQSTANLSTLARIGGGFKNAAVWATTTAVSSIVKTTGHVSGIFTRAPNPFEAESGTTLFDDRFEILTPEEITESRITFPSREEVVILDVIDPINDEDDTFEVAHDVPHEKLLMVPINLKLQSDKTSSLHWSFHSEPKGVTFGISYHGPLATSGDDKFRSDGSSSSSSASAPASGSMVASLFSTLSGRSNPTSTFDSAPAFNGQRSEVLLSLKKVHSHLRTVGGTLVPKSPGVYVFMFDNTKSSVLTKKIFLRLKLVPRSTVPPPSDC